MVDPDAGREEATRKLLELVCEKGEEGAKEKFVRLITALVRVVLEKKVGEVVRRVAEEGERRADEKRSMDAESDRKEHQRRHTKLRRDARGSRPHFNNDDDAPKPMQRTKRPRYKPSGASRRLKSTNTHEANIGSSD